MASIYKSFTSHEIVFGWVAVHFTVALYTVLLTTVLIVISFSFKFYFNFRLVNSFFILKLLY